MFICILKAYGNSFLFWAFNFNYNFIMLPENPFYVIFQNGQTHSLNLAQKKNIYMHNLSTPTYIEIKFIYRQTNWKTFSICRPPKHWKIAQKMKSVKIWKGKTCRAHEKKTLYCKGPGPFLPVRRNFCMMCILIKATKAQVCKRTSTFIHSFFFLTTKKGGGKRKAVCGSQGD